MVVAVGATRRKFRCSLFLHRIERWERIFEPLPSFYVSFPVPVLRLGTHFFALRWSSLASLAGTLPAGGSFCSGKRNQNPLRAFHPKYPPWGTGPDVRQARFRPVTFTVAPIVPLHQATMAASPMAGRFPRPGLLWWCGVATAGSQSTGSWEQLLARGRPWR